MLSKRGRSINSNIQKVFGYWYIHCRDRSSQVKGLFYTIFCKGLLFISFASFLDFFGICILLILDTKTNIIFVSLFSFEILEKCPSHAILLLQLETWTMKMTFLQFKTHSLKFR